MKIVLKGLMNRVGPPTDNFTCALTSYTGFWVGLLQSCSRERTLTTAALAGRGQAPYSPLAGYLSQNSCLRKSLGYLEVSQQCVCLGVLTGFAKAH